MPHRIDPATLAIRDDGALFSPVYGDVYHSVSGALAQADYVFIRGNGLPARWQRRRRFTIVETGFGAGANFLATWQAWRADPARCERLHFVSVEKHPFTRDDIRLVTAHIAHARGTHAGHTEIETLAEQLADAWPELLPGLHRLEFDDGRVTLTLAFGDALDLLPKLAVRADAFYLDGFAPAKNPDLWSPQIFRALAKLADEQATFATYSSAGQVKRALEEAGFSYRKVEGFDGKFAMLVGEFAPRWQVRRYAPPLAAAHGTREALVIGAGLAGGALVERLAARGWQLHLIDRHGQPASDASGNPAGVFHPVVTRDDNPASRLSRAGFLYALQRWKMLEAAGHDLARSRHGLLQIAENPEDFAKIIESAKMLRIPYRYAQAISQDAAETLLGTRVMQGGWLFPQGGSIDPARLVAAQCANAGSLLACTLGTTVQQLVHRNGLWLALDADGRAIAQAPVAIVANAHDAARLARLDHAPTQSVRGQLSLLPAHWGPHLNLPLIGDGYAVRLGDGTLMTGATYEPDDPDTTLRAADQLENLQRLARLLPSVSLDPLDAAALPGRVGFRCVASDRLPLVGALPDEAATAERRHALRGAHARDLPHAPGLYGAFAFGSRGLVWASLAAELIACQLEGEPWPIERDLAETIDPSRFLLRALRHGKLG